MAEFFHYIRKYKVIPGHILSQKMEGSLKVGDVIIIGMRASLLNRMGSRRDPYYTTYKNVRIYQTDPNVIFEYPSNALYGFRVKKLKK